MRFLISFGCGKSLKSEDFVTESKEVRHERLGVRKLKVLR